MARRICSLWLQWDRRMSVNLFCLSWGWHSGLKFQAYLLMKNNLQYIFLRNCTIPPRELLDQAPGILPDPPLPPPLESPPARPRFRIMQKMLRTMNFHAQRTPRPRSLLPRSHPLASDRSRLCQWLVELYARRPQRILRTPNMMLPHRARSQAAMPFVFANLGADMISGKIKA